MFDTDCQVLYVHQRFFIPVVNGIKQITIRQGFREIYPGEIIEIVDRSDVSRRVKVEVVETAFAYPSTVNRNYLLMDGFNDSTEYIQKITKFYPDFDENTPITVIRWRLIN